MKRILIILFLLSWVAPALAQVDTAWVRRYNGPGDGQDAAYGIAVDSSGNVYVTGGSLDSTELADYATIKYCPNGDTAWIRRYGGSGIDWALAIALDDSNNVYVTGFSEGIGTDYDYATIKYHPNGDTAWARRYDGPASSNSYDEAYAIAIDDSGNVYVTGYSWGDGTGYDYVTISYYPNGDTAWVRRYNGPGNGDDVAHGIAVDDSHNVYVTGSSYGMGTYDDYATIKYHPNGDSAWVRRYNGQGDSTDWALAIAVDDHGNVYVTGVSWDSSEADYDYATIKYYPNGDTAWVRTYGSGYLDHFACAITLDNLNNVYVTGGSGGSWAEQDYATVKYYPDGYGVLVGRYNGPENSSDRSHAIAVDDFNKAYVTGESWGSGTGPLPYDYATLKYLPPTHDVGATTILAPTGIVHVDSVIVPVGEVRNVGQSPEIFSVIFQIGSAYCDTAYVTTPLSPGGADTVSFEPWIATLAKSITYSTTCSTALDGDMYTRNDAVGGHVTVSTGLDPVILSISPNKGGNIGDVIVNIIGTRFQEGATVSIVKDGQPDIIVDTLLTTVVDSTEIKALFHLENAQVGAWDIKVVNPDSGIAVFQQGFLVEPGVQQTWTDIVGRGDIRIGRTAVYRISCSNTGNADLFGAVLRLDLSSELRCLEVKDEEGRVVFPDTGYWVGAPDTCTAGPIVFSIPILRVGERHNFDCTVLAVGGPLLESVDLWPVEPTLLVVIGGGILMHEAKSWFVEFARRKTVEYGPGDPFTLQEVLDCAKRAWLKHAWDWVDHPIVNAFNLGSSIFVSKMCQDMEDLGYTDEALMVEQGWGAATADMSGDFEILMNNIAHSLETVGWSVQAWWQSVYPKFVRIVYSWDPNDKEGPTGFDTLYHYVPSTEMFNYIVFFENDSSATADAESIWIIDTLDADLDWSTLEFGEVFPGAGPDSIHPDLNVITEFDPLNGIVSWGLFDINLPPDTAPYWGEGWVSYSIRPMADLLSGTQIQNIAGIKFDTNPWILAPMDSMPVINTIDANPPTSQVAALPVAQGDSIFGVSWLGQDDSLGSGLKDYTIYVSVDDGPYSVWIPNTTDTSTTFTGEADHEYCFYSIARDNVGHVEQKLVIPDACTRTPSYMCGDCTGDYVVDLGDVLYIISYLYKNGPPPQPLDAGDVNLDQLVDLGDVLYLISYLYKGGPPPCQSPVGTFAKLKATSADVSLQISQTKDEQVSIFLDGKFDVNVSGVQLELRWDKDKLELSNISQTARTKKLGLYHNNGKDGELKVGMVDIKGKEHISAGEGALLKVNIKSKSDSLDLSSLEINEAILFDENGRKLAVKIVNKVGNLNLPKKFSLSQNYPNPFNPQTVIKYALPHGCEVKITIYNVLGQKVRTLVDEYQNAGYKRVEWDSKNDGGEEIASGVYFYRIKAGEFTQSKKMVILK